MKTDLEILQEYILEMGQSLPEGAEKLMLLFVEAARKDDPSINSGVDLIDWMMKGWSSEIGE